MALVVKDRVKQFSTTSGTGTITLGSTPTGFEPFSVIGDGSTTYYAIVDNNTGDWEVGLGTYTLSGTTLSRDTVLSSSNAGSLVSFSANTKEVFITYPAEKAVYEQANDAVQVSALGTVTSPAYSFAADPNTGMYSPGADQIALATGGTERIKVDSAGNVGIGTSSPTQPLDVNGNVAITGTGRRITGDFSTATVANRVMFQSSTADDQTVVEAIPNGTNFGASFGASNSSSDPANASFVSVGIPNANIDVRIQSGIRGTGTYLPMTFYTSGSERFRINTSGDLINNGVFYYNARTITASITLSATDNAMSIGPIIVSDPAVVTVPDGGNWAIL